MKLSTRTQVSLGFGIALFSLAMIGATTYWSAARIEGRVDDFIPAALARTMLLTTSLASLLGFGLVSLAFGIVNRQLRRSKQADEALLATALDSIDDAIWSIDTNCRLVTFNSFTRYRVRLIFGTELQAGMQPQDSVPPDVAALWVQLYRRVLAGERFAVEQQYVIQGKLNYFNLVFNPIMSDGIVRGAVIRTQDITERKQAEDDLKRARDAAEKANRAKSDFLAKMSHELRTPLNSVIGFANVMLKNKANTLLELDLSYLERIRDNGKHLLSIINNILDLSKIEVGRMDLDLAPVSVDAVVRELLPHFEVELRGREVELLTELPETVTPIESDAGKLKQVLINLVGNAVKFTEKGGVLVRLIVDSEQRPVRLEVADTGIGIPAERQEAIFEAFQQADNTTTRKYGGTGLGLTISRSLCQLMGYRLTVQSAPGKGTTFCVHFQPGQDAPESSTASQPQPSAVRVMAPTDSESLPAAGELHNKRVLVIDDQSDSRIVLTQYIEDFGCQVLAASSGEQGLQLAREQRPDLITVDLMMPQMNGWEVVQALKTDPQLRDIPVAIVSIVAGENRGINFGVIDFVDKPVTRSDLSRVFQRFLPEDREHG